MDLGRLRLGVLTVAMMVEIGLVQVLVSSRSLGECKSGLRACLRIGAADRDYVRNCADRDDVRCLRIGTTSDELGIYEWDAGAGRTTNIKDLRSGRVASGRPSNYLRIYERDACETPCPFYYGCNRRRTATRSGTDDGFCDGRFTRSKRWLMWSWTTCFV